MFSRNWRRALRLLPPYSPDLNPIETRHSTPTGEPILAIEGDQHTTPTISRIYRRVQCTSRTAQSSFTPAISAIASNTAPNYSLRTRTIWRPESWRAWNGTDFTIVFVDPFTEQGEPERHVCAAVAPATLRWPVTSLVRHRPTGQFIAIMLSGVRDGGIYYATSPDLVHWSLPALLMPAIGLSAWTCADPPPIFYPSLLDPASSDRNFELWTIIRDRLRPGLTSLPAGQAWTANSSAGPSTLIQGERLVCYSTDIRHKERSELVTKTATIYHFLIDRTYSRL